MATSINGWPVLAPGDGRLHTFPIPGVADRRLTLARDAAPILLYVASQYHEQIHPLAEVRRHGKLVRQKTVDEGGYNYRKSRVNTSWSNHSSGTAIDLDWSKEGAQSSWARSWWQHHPAKRAAVDHLLQELDGSITWGGKWSPKYWDPMHFEITRGWTAEKLLRLQRKLGIDGGGVRA